MIGTLESVSSIVGTYGTGIAFVVGTIIMGAAGLIWVRSRARRKAADGASVKGKEPEVTMTSTVAAASDREAPDVEPAKEKEMETDMNSNSSEESDKDMPTLETADGENSAEDETDAPGAESAESAEDEAEEQDEASAGGAEPEPKPKTGDAVFDLFTADIEEESNVGKFASTLDDVDIQDLSQQAHDLLEQLKDMRGR